MDQRSRIAILGFGLEGRAVLKYLTKHNYTEITVCDKNVDIDVELPDGVSANLGKDVYLDDLDKFDVIFRSPGIRSLTPQLVLAKEVGVEVTSSTAYFLDQVPCEVIGVTGTKGKGTTSTLIHKIIEKSGRKSFLGGNIGVPAISFLDEVEGDNLVVLEMSSFQLQDLTKSPHYSVLLNTTLDHLDYHADVDEYMMAKEALLAHQKENSLAVLNKDYEYSKYYLPLVRGKQEFVSVHEEVKDGAYTKDGEIFYVKDGKSEAIIKTKDVGLVGAHNFENIMPAIVIAKALGIKTKDIVSVVKDFTGLEHRLELVRELKGVKFYNDSFSTTQETSMAAVESFNVPTVLIAGGSSKGLKYDKWAEKILTKESLEVVILIGEIAEEMEKELVKADKRLGDKAGSPTKILHRKTLEDAIVEAYALSEEGGVVVMSPAAASFDMFKDYKQRGIEFRSIVNSLG